jgi:glycosyltransferase involved in cell wall biosynthesis
VRDVRWFSPNRYCALPVPALRRVGLEIALESEQAAGLAFAADGACVAAAFEYSRRHRCPLALYIWDLPPWRLGGGKADLVFEAGGRLLRLPRLRDRYPERAGYYSRMRHAARRADAVWCPSTNTVEDVERHFGVGAERVPFCYDSDRFPGPGQFPLSAAQPALSEAKGSPLTLLSVSRLVPHKNHAVILRAAARISGRPLVRILGEGPEAENLRRLAESLGVRLDLPGGWASDQAIHAAYREASVLVCPSRFEGFGLTPLEGLAMGLPVVASDIPPHREFLGDAVRYFAPNDDASLAWELEAALARPPRPPPSGARGRPAVQPSILAPLTISSCASRLLPGLMRLLGRAP